MKTYLKILAALAGVAFLFLATSYALYVREHPIGCSDTLTLTGKITFQTFVDARKCLVRWTAPKKTVVVEASEGGDNAAALALGILIHRHGWDVEIVDYCASACASFIFPAGKTIYLNRQSLLLFHGAPSQENLMEMAESFVPESPTNPAPAEPVTLGQVNKENTVSMVPKTAAYREVHEFLAIADSASPLENLRAQRQASEQLYRELGINPLLPTYGQLGEYEKSYKSYKLLGFIYPLDSLRRLGMRNIELKEGEWHPERHPAYKDVYEVTYP